MESERTMVYGANRLENNYKVLKLLYVRYIERNAYLEIQPSVFYRPSAETQKGWEDDETMRKTHRSAGTRRHGAGGDI
jgi:hypothetical protein